jgi:hypothetical protein
MSCYPECQRSRRQKSLCRDDARIEAARRVRAVTYTQPCAIARSDNGATAASLTMWFHRAKRRCATDAADSLDRRV